MIEPTIPIHITEHFGQIAAENKRLREVLESVDRLFSTVMNYENLHVYEPVAARVTAVLAAGQRNRTVERLSVTVPERVTAIRDHYKGVAERIGNQGGGDRTLNDIDYLLGYIEHLVGYIGEIGEEIGRVSPDE